MEKSPLFLMEYDKQYDFRTKHFLTRATAHIQAGVCVYWKSHEGPCSMCPLPVYQLEYLGGRLPTWSNLGPAFQAGWAELADGAELVRIFHGGNFIIEDEVTPESQEGIISFLSQQRSVKRIIIESKPEYITEERLDRITTAVGANIELQMNMGFEVYNHGARAFLKKGFTDEDYVRAVQLLQEYSIYPFVYLLIQPPGITAAEAVASVAESVRWVTGIDPDTETALLSLYIEKKTPAYKLWERGEYTPPTVTAVYESLLAAHEAHPKGMVSFGGFRDNEEIEPVAYSKPRDAREQRLYDAILQFKEDCDISKLKQA